MKIKLKGVYVEKGCYWYVRKNGKRFYCGKGAEGKRLAIDARKKADVEKRENREVAAGLKVKRLELKTVNELLDWYLSKPAIQTQKSYMRKIQSCAHLKKFFGHRPVSNIDGSIQEEYRDERTRQGMAPQTINLEIQILSTAYHLAIKRHKIPASAKPGEFIKDRNYIPRRLITDTEFKKILEAATDDFKDFLIVAYETGMRSAEIRGLKPKKVRLDENYLHDGQRFNIDYIALGRDTKTKAERFVPVTPEVKAILKRRMRGLATDDLIFSDPTGSRFAADAISLRMRWNCKRAGVAYGDKKINDGERVGVVFHCLRHTRITKWILAGYSDEVIRSWSGHKNLDSYRRYVHLGKAVVVMFQNQFFGKTSENQRKAL